MATVNIMKNTRSQTRAGLAFILAYCKREAKTQHEDRRLVTGINCVAEFAYREMMNTKLQYGKTDGRVFYHLVQSFSPAERITPQRAHELALKLAESEFSGFEVLVATHVDKHHIHSHFVVNSVSSDSGRKLHAGKDFIPKLREASDRLCMEFDLSVVYGKKKDKQAERMSSREYRAADRGESWKMRLIVTIEEAMAAARSRGEFIRMMEAEGYSVRWTAERKYITYTTPDGQKCRDNKLHEEKFLKENMENEFGIRNEIFFGAESSCKEKHTDGGTGAALRGGNGTQLESVIDTQKAQLAMLAKLMDTASALSTKDELTEQMQWQIQVLTEHTENSYLITKEFQTAMKQAAAEYTASMKAVLSDMSKQAGNMSESFSRELSRTKDTMKKYMRKIFWITIIPSAITIIYYLTPLILSLISRIF